MHLDVRRNPALLKLDLYCKGMRIDDSLSRRAGRGAQDPAHPRRARQRARGRPARRPVDERPGHRDVRPAVPLRARTARTARYVLKLGDEAVTARRALAAPGVVRQEDLDRQADDPRRHAAGHLPRGLPGEGLRVLDREAAEVELQVLLGRPEPRRGRRRRQVGRRGAWRWSAPRATSRASPTWTSTPATTRATPTSTSSSPTSGASRSEIGPAGRRPDAAAPRPQALRRAARDGRQPRVVLLRDLRPRRLRGGLPRQGPRSTASSATSTRSSTARARAEGAAQRALGHQRRDHRRPRAAGVVDRGHRLDHVGGRHPHRLRLPPAGRHRLRGRAAAADRGR